MLIILLSFISHRIREKRREESYEGIKRKKDNIQDSTFNRAPRGGNGMTGVEKGRGKGRWWYRTGVGRRGREVQVLGGREGVMGVGKGREGKLQVLGGREG